jgi:hypothetical protein
MAMATTAAAKPTSGRRNLKGAFVLDALFVAAVVGALILAFARPGTACGLTMSGFVIEQAAQAFVPLAGHRDELLNYVVAAAVILAISRQLLHHGPEILLPGPATWATLALLGYTGLTVLWSLFPSTTERSLMTAVPYLGLFAFLAPLTIQSPPDIEDALSVLIFGSTTALLLLLLFAHWEGRAIHLPDASRLSNPLALTQAAGSVLVTATLTSIVRRASGRFFVPGVAIIATVVLLAFIRTQSRGQIVGALGVTALFAAVARRGRIWLGAGALGFVLVVASGFVEEEMAANAMRWNQRQVTKDVAEDRLAWADQLFDYWLASNPTHELLGLGNAAAQDPRLLGVYPHIVPIEVLCEEGVLGALFYTLMLFVAARNYWSLVRRSNRTEVDSFAPAMFALYCYEFTLTLKQGTLTGNATFLLFVTLSDSMRRIYKTKGQPVVAATERPVRARLRYL